MSVAVETITIRVLFFAQIKSYLGDSELALSMPASSSVSDVQRLLSERNPKVCAILEVSRFTINGEYVPAQSTLHDGDEVAVIPPVSGG